jgi:hypothetical protein
MPPAIFSEFNEFPFLSGTIALMPPDDVLAEIPFIELLTGNDAGSGTVPCNLGGIGGGTDGCEDEATSSNVKFIEVGA